MLGEIGSPLMQEVWLDLWEFVKEEQLIYQKIYHIECRVELQ